MAGQTDKPKITVPSIEAVEYARKAVGQVRDLIAKWEAEAIAKGHHDDAERHHWAKFLLEHKLLGYEDGGCVITAFDKRWLDPKFREAMEAIG